MILSGDNSANEGQTNTYTYTITDPGQDPTPVVNESCGTNGTYVNTAAASSFDCTFLDGPASSIATVTANDGDPSNSIGSASITVAIANVAPTVTFSAGNDQSVPEGQTRTYNYSISDPGQDTVTAVATSCDPPQGTKVPSSDTNTNTAGSFQCTFPDGPATAVLSAAATDSDGATGATATQSVSVTNVAPTVTFSAGNDQSVPEGQTRTYNYSISDPGQDTVTAVATSCDPPQGTKVPSSDTNTNTAGSFQCTFPDGPATAVLSAAATDSDGATGATATQSVSVTNVAPTVTFSAGNDQSVPEGQTRTYNYSISDPGQDTVTAVATSCDPPQGTKVPSSDTNTNTAGSFQCTFPDGPATAVLSAAATDSDGATGATATQSVSVTNVAPTVTFSAGNDQSVPEGQTRTYNYSISDPGQDTVTAVATSCDPPQGTKVPSSDTNTNTAGSFQCTFPDGPATAVLSAAATDSDGATGATATQSVSVTNVAPTVTFSAGNDQSVPEGQTRTYNYSISDPGQDTVTAVATSCDPPQGTKLPSSDTNTNTAGSFQCTFPDGPATAVLSAAATDSDGATGATATQA